MDLGLKDKIVLVTGGAKGIGAETARAVAQEGAVPVIVDKDATSGSDLECELVRQAYKAKFIECELASAEQTRDAVASAVQSFGRIDALVNNAGVNDRVGLENGSPDQYVAS